MADTLLLCAGGLCLFTAIVHSILGERRLIIPLLHLQAGVMTVPLARQIIRFAWHWTSLLWFLIGAVLLWAGLTNSIPQGLLIAIGAVHVAMGLLDAFITKGRHIGWPFITLIGVLTLLAVI